ncbi:MAG: hypothetical protein K2Y56_20475 [Methylobacterium sp.]|uniref:hypothetical protein n=1 Tax=Methylobacterium sp. TaxID=409 RepID=UPI0025DCDB60|nr:hypothetical protein [Methylobacterium sp.]MBX9933865.1 hypothetical protein [Methylobacterium sp.]
MKTFLVVTVALLGLGLAPASAMSSSAMSCCGGKGMMCGKEARMDMKKPASSMRKSAKNSCCCGKMAMGSSGHGHHGMTPKP